MTGKPSVAPEDEALMKRFGDTLHRFRTVPSDENHKQMREADEALRRHMAGLRAERDNAVKVSTAYFKRLTEAEAALAACRDAMRAAIEELNGRNVIDAQVILDRALKTKEPRDA